MNKESKFCESCGAKTVKYKHSFSNALAIGLYKLYESGNISTNLKHLKLTRNQWDNFQKFRCWGLVKQAYRPDGTRLNGEWIVTQEGIDFIERGTSIQKSVWTYRGKTVDFEGDTCFFLDVHEPSYKKRLEYWDEAEAKI